MTLVTRGSVLARGTCHLTVMAEKAAITHRFLKRKIDEYEALKAEIEALRFEVEKSGGEGTQKA